MPALLAEGMCYQVLKSSNAQRAATYGAKAVDILMKMSCAVLHGGGGNQGRIHAPTTAMASAIYGVGFGLGYDWVYDLLTSSATQIYTTGNAWITGSEASGRLCRFEYEHPLSNYFAGYFHAKAVHRAGNLRRQPVRRRRNGTIGTVPSSVRQRVQPYFA